MAKLRLNGLDADFDAGIENPASSPLNNEWLQLQFQATTNSRQPLTWCNTQMNSMHYPVFMNCAKIDLHWRLSIWQRRRGTAECLQCYRWALLSSYPTYKPPA